ncbi:DUF29 domain-containing protein [Paracraurococcus lichenis]|uniref:DUF29 domain-containing protein n=1 Tax=Paracraurococcus lichenis TaxID=3064888 RepID=A0ABT9E1K7_9PROT|nr:DUF29 domain-containing protein [Paracraurococcus sp. LOR1-02]MDO9710047.1 DUF29 domain-containing protein [Paracraurococcus sp. LOR1-02]
MSDAAELYERDFYAWTQDQAATLRAWPEKLRPNALDIAHLAEEIEDLGSSQRNSAKSFLFQILVHLLKMKFHPDQQPRGHWRDEVGNFRAQLDIILSDSPSLRSRRAELASGEWRRAARQVSRSLEDDGHATAAADLRLFTADQAYFDLDRQVLDPDWLP